MSVQWGSGRTRQVGEGGALPPNVLGLWSPGALAAQTRKQNTLSTSGGNLRGVVRRTKPLPNHAVLTGLRNQHKTQNFPHQNLGEGEGEKKSPPNPWFPPPPQNSHTLPLEEVHEGRVWTPRLNHQGSQQGREPFPPPNVSALCQSQKNSRKCPSQFSSGEKSTSRTFFSGRLEHCAQKEVRRGHENQEEREK